MLRINNIKLDIESNEEKLLLKAARILNIDKNEIKKCIIVKKSVDARDKRQLLHVYNIDIEIQNEEQYVNIKNVQKATEIHYVPVKAKSWPKHRPIIVGSGPAGLFCGLILAEAGFCPLILERGKMVDERKKDVDQFWSEAVLNIHSNVQFGEGGAGTFSDGKLTTGTKDVRIHKVLEEFIRHGAPEEIRYTAKPHIGTDKLMKIIKNIRNHIISLGGEFRFSSCFTGFEAENGQIRSCTYVNGPLQIEESVETENIVLAIGHSARDTIKMLYENGVYLEAKAFSAGVRIEHRQQFIDEAQYGRYAGHPKLGAADYKLSAHLKNKRGVYTFCMCPGGCVVGATSEAGAVVTNGMSYYSRSMENANSGLLVSISPKDYGLDSPLDGIYFQQDLEHKAFLLGGSNYNAPVQTVADFLKGQKTTALGGVIPSYQPGFTTADFRECFTEDIISALKEAILLFDKKLNGFAAKDAVLTGVESRSSSPVRIQRNEGFESNLAGLYPCGEGAGYAGGIISAAVDGIKCGQAMINKYNEAGM